MSNRPILFMGGSGAIGQETAHALRAAHPGIPLLIGGRDLDKVRRAAQAVSDAEAVVIDPDKDDLGLGRREVSAVVVFYMDHTLAGLRFAQKRCVPHLSISSGVFEIAPEIAAYMHTPGAGPIVLGYEWLVGATTVSTLEAAKAFARVRDIRIGALVDAQERAGPTVATDFEHLNRLLPAALTRRDGVYLWREGAKAQTHFRAIDGTLIEATGFSSIDVVGLATATGAANVQFNLASGVTSTRRQGKPASTEIIIELDGEGLDGHPLATRHAVFHPGGAAPLTVLGITMLIERLIALDGKPPTPAGLYFPYQLLDSAAYLTRLKQQGGDVKLLHVL